MAGRRAQRPRDRVLQAEDSAASSAPSSPEPPGMDDDENFFATHRNDSQSSFGNSELSRQSSMHSIMTQRVFKAPVERLPNEMLIGIFAKLGSPAELFRVMQVCKAWATCAVDLLWHRPLFTEFDRLITITHAMQNPNALFPYHSLVRRLNLSNLAKDVNDGTLAPFEFCKRVERLTLTQCNRVTDQALVAMIEGNKALLALDITNLEQVTDQTIHTLSRHSPRLQGLNITGCEKITDESLQPLSLGCKYLKRLKFNKCKLITDESIVAFAEGCPAMLEIDLQQCENITDVSVNALLSKCPSLRELRLAQCNKITDAALTQLPRSLKLDALRIIDLTACSELTDIAVERLIEAAPRLRIIVLAKCNNITDKSVNAICKLGKNLHDIHLGRCNMITDEALKKLIKDCNRIRYIDLAACQHITDDSVSHLAELPKLRRIGLVKCTGVTDVSIQALVKSNHQGSHNLERVHLSYCLRVTVPGIHALLNACPKLTHLSLTGIGEFLSPSIRQFCRAAPSEFNDEQQQVFCVFSGDGVSKLRDHLNAEVVRNARIAEGNRDRPGHNPAAQHDADGAGDIHMFDDGMGDEDEGMAGMLQNTQLDNDEFD